MSEAKKWPSGGRDMRFSIDHSLSEYGELNMHTSLTFNGKCDQMSHEILSLEEGIIKEALQKLGWSPPAKDEASVRKDFEEWFEETYWKPELRLEPGAEKYYAHPFAQGAWRGFKAAKGLK